MSSMSAVDVEARMARLLTVIMQSQSTLGLTIVSSLTTVKQTISVASGHKKLWMLVNTTLLHTLIRI